MRVGAFSCAEAIDRIGPPLRIGMVADYLPPGRIGGVGEVVVGLRDAYRRKGHEVIVFTTGSGAKA